MKQKRQVILLVFGIILILFIAGCDGGGDVTSKSSPFVGGSKGLVLKFLPDDPPVEIADGDIFPFVVVVSMTNEGEFKFTASNQVRVDLKGILANDFGRILTDIIDVHPSTAPTPRQKDSEGNIIEPIETFVTIPKNDNNLRLKKDIIKGNTEYLFRADVCYQYGTIAIAKICILENMITVADDAICNPRGEKKVFSSGSPVQITSFRQSVAGLNRIQFSFDIEHVGKGKVFKDITPSSTGVGCPKGLAQRRAQENVFSLEIDTGIPSTLTCVGIGTSTVGKVTRDEVRLVNGKRTVTCTQTISSAFLTDLERNVDITLKFDYFDTVDKTVLAKHIIVDVVPSFDFSTGGVVDDGTGKKSCKIDGDLTTKCLDVSCGSNTLVPGSCTTTDVCTCGNLEFSCSGDCTTVDSGQDVVFPTVTGIVPEYAIVETGSGGAVIPVNQLFVIRDVFDGGGTGGGFASGIKSCKITNLQDAIDFDFNTDETRQGPDLCNDEQESSKCDFVDLISFSSTGPKVTLEATCEDFSGKSGKASVFVKVVPKSNLAEEIVKMAEGIAADKLTAGTGPIIEELVTDVTVRDKTTQIVASGIYDTESGVQDCKLLFPGAGKEVEITDPPTIPTPGIHVEKFPFGTLSGLIRTMTLQGPKPCLGPKDGPHGKCLASIPHKFVTGKTKQQLLGGETRFLGTHKVIIYCTNYAGKSTNTESITINVK